MLCLASREYDVFDTPAIVTMLQKAVNHAFLPDIHILSWKGFVVSMDRSAHKPNLQKQVAIFLESVAITFDAANLLTQRLARWIGKISDDAMGLVGLQWSFPCRDVYL